jgi:hypothetical protein
MYRLLPHVQLVLVKVPGLGDDYRINYHYQAGGAPNDFGPVIPWLSGGQREQFLAEGLVEEIPDAEEPPPAGDSGATSAVDNCVGALDSLNVAFGAGAPTCRDALREAGLRFENRVIAAAVKRRKEQLVAVPDSAR